MGRDPRFRRLGDLAAGTIVIVEERHAVAAPLRLDPPPIAGRAARPARSASRSPATSSTPSSSSSAASAASRPRASDELAEMVAPCFARRMGVRYKDATRFLGVLHYRAHEHRGRSRSGPRPAARRRDA